MKNRRRQKLLRQLGLYRRLAADRPQYFAHRFYQLELQKEQQNATKESLSDNHQPGPEEIAAQEITRKQEQLRQAIGRLGRSLQLAEGFDVT